ncbi:MAG: methyltransferase domain-containing protein [Cyclobacteriaceae bacterium]|nr:methyltransferase domain-containing protein [Cyclobacteriaceae bacterium]
MTNQKRQQLTDIHNDKMEGIETLKKKNGKMVRNHIGPTPDLEKHLKPDWWKRIFNSMYLKTDADVVEDKSITAQEVGLFIESLNLGQEDSVLDLACGQGRHLFELARRGFKNLSGLDRSRYLIQKARTRSKLEGVSIAFKEGDARKLPFPTDTFDCVTILGNSFGYFESTDDDQKILKEVFRVLKPGGQLLMDVADGEWLKVNYVQRSWEWIDKKHFVCRERSLASDNERLVSREVVTNIEKGVVVDQFYAERLYTRQSLNQLINLVGFKQLEFHGQIGSASQRNQDLGMMERRMILTAHVIKEWSPKKLKKAVKNIVVLMGDPSLNDIIKPDEVFDDDDFNTINQLKVALSKLGDYKFSYLNNHATLSADLMKIKGKTDFVFNLCDEGFNNEAIKELHIPALLEVLKLPYTGSNPQNLAYCYDKSLIRGIANEMGVPVADAFFIKPEDNLFEINISFPVIAKPNFGDSSFGITQKSVAANIEELSEAILKIRQQFGYGKPILVEEFLTGAEISVGIIGNVPEDYMVLPVIEEDYSDLPDDLPRICGYEAKWLPGSPYFKALKSVPANLPREMESTIVSDCLKLFERLECRDYCRFDWRFDQHGQPKLLEVNPNPGWCWDGHLAKMAHIGGKDYSGMLDAILKAAERRITI